jgi:hypothetical protein
LLGEIMVDFEVRKAPGVWRNWADPTLEEILDVAVVLLKVMGPKEQTF